MADVKISALALIAAASISATDRMPLVDDIGGVPTTYGATVADLRSAFMKGGAGFTGTDYLALGAGTIPTTGMIRVGQGAIATASSPLINSTVTWNDAAVTFTHILVNLTNTASNAASLFADYQVSAASKWKLTALGAVTQAGNLTISAGGLTVTAGTSALQGITGTTYVGSSTGQFGGTLTVTSGGAAITGNSTITGTLGGLTGLTVASGGASITGNSTITGTLGGLTGLTVASGGAAITGNSTITGTLGGVTTFTVTTVTATNLGGTVTTAAQPNITSTGILAALHMTSPVVDSGGLTITLGGLTVSAGTSAHQAITGTTYVGSSTGQFGGTLTVTSGGVAVTGNSTITGTLGGVTTFTVTTVTATNLGGTLTTAAQPNITSTGVLASPHMTSPVVDSGGLTISAGGLTVSSGTSAHQAMTGTTLALSSNFSVASGALVYLDGGGDTYITEATANNVSILAGGLTVLQILNGATDATQGIKTVAPTSTAAGVWRLGRKNNDGGAITNATLNVMVDGINLKIALYD